jgi:hypothetical protein
MPPVDPGYGVPMPPLGIWGGAPPAHVGGGPVYPRPPVDPGYGIDIPVDPWYGRPVVPPHPAHPIVKPPTEPPPVDPPEVPPGGQPGDNWSWYYTKFGWVLVWVPPGNGGKPQPVPTPPVATPV